MVAGEAAVCNSVEVLWICDKDPSHEYSVRIAHMVENNTGCSICRSQKNLLKNVRPELKSQYSSKNPIPFDEIKANSHNPVFWSCEKGHEWKAPPGRRVKSQQVLCKFCEKEKNLLINLFPNVSQEIRKFTNGNHMNPILYYQQLDEIASTDQIENV